MKREFKLGSLALAIASVFVLSACDTSINVTETDDHGHDHDHDHDHGHAESSGRLVLMESGSTRAHVYDLADDHTFDAIDLGFESAIYASPGQRYALAVQREQGQVRLIDGGFEVEPHGDHNHNHMHDPSLLSYSLIGEMPTHYDYFLTRGAVFYDGSDGVSSKVEVISDHSIGEERLVASLGLSTNMHGAAEVRGEHLFATYRSDPAASSTLPDYVEVYEQHGDHYDFVQRFEEPCPGLHGSAINLTSVAFGCTDGVLLITEDSHAHSHDHDHADFEAAKIANPEGFEGRVGSLWAHEAHNFMIGRAGQSLVVIDADHDHGMQVIDWRAEGHTDTTIVSVAFNYSGNRFAVLDSTGELTIIRLRDHDHENYPYQIQSRFEVLEHLHDGNAAMTVSAVNHQAYITDAEHNQIVIVDLHDGEIIDTRDLSFTPAGAVWLGFTEEEDDHNH
ncbi:MAG: hypothetical protein JJU03_09955 [Idiomarina sp.]|nr:hypothetical protein [Idiomarina sp.]